MLLYLLCGICFTHCIFLLNNYLLFATIIIHPSSDLNYLICSILAKHFVANSFSSFLASFIGKVSPKSHFLMFIVTHQPHWVLYKKKV